MIGFKCSECGKSFRVPDEAAGKRGKCPSCGTVLSIPAADIGTGDVQFIGAADAVLAQKPASRGSKHAVLLAVGILATIIAQCFKIHHPGAYTVGALLACVLIQPVSYFAILSIVALVVGGIRKSARKYWFPTLAWLFFIAGLFDVVVGGWTEFVVRPRIDKDIAAIVQGLDTRDIGESPSSAGQRGMTKLTGRHGNYSIEYDESKWAYDPDIEGDHEFAFVHRDGDVYAMIIAERLPISAEMLKQVVTTNFQAGAKDFRLIRQEHRTVAGQDVLHLTMSGSVDDVRLVHDGYYYTGEAGTIQVVTVTGANLYEHYKQDMTDFLNGFRVITAPSSDSRPQDALLGHWITSDNLVNYYFSSNKMTVVQFAGQPGRELAYSVLKSRDGAVTLKMIGGNVPHTREFIFHGPRKATQITRIGVFETKYEISFVDEKQFP